MSAPATEDMEQAHAYLEELREETMLLAWGGYTEYRRRIVVAAMTFGRWESDPVEEKTLLNYPDPLSPRPGR